MKDQDLLEMLLKGVTRFEVIDHSSKKRGRYVVEYGVKVEASIQDEGRTLKIFLTDPKK